MPSRKCRLIVVMAFVIALAGPTISGFAQDNWPQFRGPGAAGVATRSDLPHTWSTEENVLWQTKIPGRGWSSPIVWGERVFLTTTIKEEGELEKIKEGLYFLGERPTPTEPHRWKVYCLDTVTGRILWDRVAHQGVPEQGHHLKNTFASETPVTDGERLYAYFGNVGLFCYDLAGELLWKKKLGSHPIRFGWGTASSPVLHDDRLYIVHDNEEQSFLVALDKRTGDEIWRVERDEKSNWSTPFIWENKQRTEIVTPGSGKTRAYDLQGRPLWELTGASGITIATPFAAHGLLYVSSGYIMDPRKPIWAIRPGATGDISLVNEDDADDSADADEENTKDDPAAAGTIDSKELNNPHIAWYQQRAAPYNPTTICHGNYLYVLYDRGMFACYDARTGEKIYGKQRIGEGARAFTASPWACDDRIFCLSEDGDTYVIQAGREFKLLGKNSLDEFSMATPAIARDSLFIRTETRLYCIRQENTAAPASPEPSPPTTND